MTKRQQQLCKKILQAAFDADGGQLTVVELHAACGGTAAMTGTEFDACLEICDRERWLTGVANKFNPREKIWNLNSRGEAAMRDL